MCNHLNFNILFIGINYPGGFGRNNTENKWRWIYVVLLASKGYF